MARANIRAQDGENLTPSAIEDVISKLEAEKPITKKLACQLLKISYNTKRLGTILEDYTDRKNYVIKRKKELKNTAISTQDEKYIVSSYLGGGALQEISDNVFRSVGKVKSVLHKYNIPIRNSCVSYHNPIDLNAEEMQPDNYTIGDLVYAARYDSTAEVRKVFISKSGDGVYRLWLFKHNQYAMQPYYELSDLRGVQEHLGVEMEYMKSDECIQEVQLGLRNAKLAKRKNNE